VTDPARGVEHHFDAWAPSYDAQIREMVPRYEEIHDTLLALLSLRPPERFLDLGSGTGYTLRRVLEAFPGARAVGLDVSTEMLERARQRLAGLERRVDLRVSDIARPELDATYDAIVSILAVHHLYPDEKRHLFSRIWEHIEPGGVFLLADYFRPAMDRLSELYDLPEEPDSHEVEHDHPDTAAEHLLWLTAAGFAAVDVVWKYDDVGVLVAWREERAARPAPSPSGLAPPRGRAAAASRRGHRRIHRGLRQRPRRGGRAR
jgi:tRNA (cmo5U34)-methyltransferase